MKWSQGYSCHWCFHLSIFITLMLIEKNSNPNYFRCHNVLASSISTYACNPDQHLSVCPFTLWLYPWSFPPFDIQPAHFSSAWCSVLLATPILEFVSESQPVWFGVLVATHTLQLPLKGEGCWTQGSPSHLFWLKRKRLHCGYSPKPKPEWKWQAIWGWGVTFPLSGKFALLTSG